MDKEAMCLNGSIKKRVVTSTMRWFVDPKDARHVSQIQTVNDCVEQKRPVIVKPAFTFLESKPK